MIDAWAKPQTGILSGNVMHIGNYDECLGIHTVQNGTKIQGKYCSTFIEPTDKDLVEYMVKFMQASDVSFYSLEGVKIKLKLIRAKCVVIIIKDHTLKIL